MFSIFKPKAFLIDQLDGFTDIHNHLLPGIDDGAKNVEDSISLITALREIGFVDFICTPHTMSEIYPNTPESIGIARDILRNELEKRKLDTTRIHAASEYMMDESFQDLIEEDQLLTLKNRFVLVEMSYLQPPINLEEIIFDLSGKGYVPVLAHPERYAYLHGNYNYFDKLKKMGCLLQLNMLSLSEHYGSSVQEMAYKLLDDKMYSFIGSDVHHIHHVKLLKQVKYPKAELLKLQRIIQNTKDAFAL